MSVSPIRPTTTMREISDEDKMRVRLLFLAQEQWILEPYVPLGDILFELHQDSGLNPTVRGDQLVGRESLHVSLVLGAWASGMGVPVEEPEDKPRVACATPGCGHLAYWNLCGECSMKGRAERG